MTEVTPGESACARVRVIQAGIRAGPVVHSNVDIPGPVLSLALPAGEVIIPGL